MTERKDPLIEQAQMLMKDIGYNFASANFAELSLRGQAIQMLLSGPLAEHELLNRKERELTQQIEEIRKHLQSSRALLEYAFNVASSLA